MKINAQFVMDCVADHFNSAVQYGVNRAYKHSDKEPPTDAQVETIQESVRSALFEIFTEGE